MIASQLSVDVSPRRLVIDLGGDHDTLSWATVGSGRSAARTVVVHHATDDDLTIDVDPQEWLAAQLEAESLDHAIGLLTSRRVERYTAATATSGRLSVSCLATVGLGNALRIGDPALVEAYVGTINLVVRTSFGLTEGALVEAVSLVSEARTLAVLDADIESAVSGLRATGTGTDSIVVAAARDQEGLNYAGKHTVCGQLIGEAVLRAMRAGIPRWNRDVARYRQIGTSR